MRNKEYLNLNSVFQSPAASAVWEGLKKVVTSIWFLCFCWVVSLWKRRISKPDTILLQVEFQHPQSLLSTVSHPYHPYYPGKWDSDTLYKANRDTPFRDFGPLKFIHPWKCPKSLTFIYILRAATHHSKRDKWRVLAPQSLWLLS